MSALPETGSIVTTELLEKAGEVIGHKFQNPAIIREALTHASVADNRLLSNERMEFLGDAVLDLIVCEELFRRYPSYSEGDLTKVKSAVVSRRTCAEVSIDTGLVDLLVTGKGIATSENMPMSLAAAVYESIVAAVYLDGGFDAAKSYILRTICPKIDAVIASSAHQNYKAVLQQYSQKTLGASPVYELLDEKGPDHAKCFEVGVEIAGRRFPAAWGPNKKQAEQKAALMALEELEVLAAREVDEAVDALNSEEV